MNAVSSLPRDAHWSQGHGRHELRAGGDILATLDLTGVRAKAATPVGTWRIERDMTRTIRVWDTTTTELVAEVSKSTWAGRRNVEFADGRSVTWEPANIWRTQWCFRTSNRKTQLVFARRGDPIPGNHEGDDADRAQVALLTVLARYLSIVSANDDGVAAAAAVVGSVVT